MLDGPKLKPRSVHDANFEHCARTLLPFTAFNCGSLEESDLQIDPEIGVKPSDIINAIRITTEVALAFSIERYGRTRVRIAAGRREIP